MLAINKNLQYINFEVWTFKGSHGRNKPLNSKDSHTSKNNLLLSYTGASLDGGSMGSIEPMDF